MDSRAAQPAVRPRLRGLPSRSTLERPRTAPARVAGRLLRVLFLVSAHNGLSRRVQIALTDLGHDVSVAVVASATAMEAAVERHRPELIVCPFLKTNDPRVGLRPPSLPDRAPGPPRRSWAVVARLGDRARCARVGRHGAGGDRRGG